MAHLPVRAHGTVLGEVRTGHADRRRHRHHDGACHHQRATAAREEGCCRHVVDHQLYYPAAIMLLAAAYDVVCAREGGRHVPVPLARSHCMLPCKLSALSRQPCVLRRQARRGWHVKEKEMEGGFCKI